MIADDAYDFEGMAVCVWATPGAIKVEVNGEERWIPKSAVHDDSEVYDKGHEGKLIVKMWWATKEGIFDPE